MTRPGDPFDPAKPGGLAAEIADIRRRLRRLETASRLVAASAVDDDGVFRTYFGAITDPDDGTVTDYGMRIDAADANADGIGGVVLQVGDEGIVFPVTNLGAGWHEYSEGPVAITAGTFTPTYVLRAFGWVGGHVACDFPVQTDSGTTGEVQLYEFFTGETTNTITLGSATNGTITCAWELPDTLARNWYGNPSASHGMFMQIRARRTGGSGDVKVYRPWNFNIGGDTWIAGNPSASALTLT